MCPYVIGSEIFGQGSEREEWLIDYLQNHGGIAMGMIRTMPHQGQFNDEPGVNPLYGLRYQLALLRRDEREQALVGFYGQLAQGMTRGTFIGGEGSRFCTATPTAARSTCRPTAPATPPGSSTLRYLLVQDWDLDEDGDPTRCGCYSQRHARGWRTAKRSASRTRPPCSGPSRCTPNRIWKTVM